MRHARAGILSLLWNSSFQSRSPHVICLDDFINVPVSAIGETDLPDADFNSQEFRLFV